MTVQELFHPKDQSVQKTREHILEQLKEYILSPDTKGKDVSSLISQLESLDNK